MGLQFTGKNALHVVSFILFSAMSASSFAQSREYQRGYDQGYRDGLQAQSYQDQQDRPAGRILIEEANYGIREASCDASEIVQNAIGRRRNVSIAANNDLCGDPAPNHPKQLNIIYRCGDGPTLRAWAREGGIVTLNCR